MYLYKTCKCPDCQKLAISEIDQNGNLVENGDWCLEHHPDAENNMNRIHDYVMSHEKIVGLSASGINISGIDLSDKKFYGCNFSNSTMSNIHANGLRARMCIYDNCTFTDCDFLSSNIQYSSVAGCKMVHMILTGSDLIHNNFNGITAYQCSFDDSDLYNSRFIKAMLMNTSIANCNLKKTVFFNSIREGVSFKLSNTKEALFDRSKGGMMGDLDTQLSEEEDIL